jgi:Flp pilus assembly protein TadG
MIKSRHSTRRPGSSTVELAFILPIFLLVVFGILEYARYLFAQDVLNNAAREGARYAVVNTNNGVTLTNVQNYVNNYLAGTGAQLQGFVPTGANNVANIRCYRCDPTTGLPLATWLGTNDWTNASYGTPIAVEITGVITPMVPTQLLSLPSTLKVSAKAIMYTEAN